MDLGRAGGPAHRACRPDEGEVDAERPVDAAAVYTYEDTVGDRGPGGVITAAVKTRLTGEGWIGWSRTKSSLSQDC